MLISKFLIGFSNGSLGSTQVAFYFISLQFFFQRLNCEWLLHSDFRLCGHSYTPVMEATYLAQHALSPSMLGLDYKDYQILRMTPKEYKARWSVFEFGAIILPVFFSVPKYAHSCLVKLRCSKYILSLCSAALAE